MVLGIPGALTTKAVADFQPTIMVQCVRIRLKMVTGVMAMAQWSVKRMANGTGMLALLVSGFLF